MEKSDDGSMVATGGVYLVAAAGNHIAPDKAGTDRVIPAHAIVHCFWQKQNLRAVNARNMSHGETCIAMSRAESLGTQSFYTVWMV